MLASFPGIGMVSQWLSKGVVPNLHAEIIRPRAGQVGGAPVVRATVRLPRGHHRAESAGSFRQESAVVFCDVSCVGAAWAKF